MDCMEPLRIVHESDHGSYLLSNGELVMELKPESSLTTWRLRESHCFVLSVFGSVRY
jgi:hypothetical protein